MKLENSQKTTRVFAVSDLHIGALYSDSARAVKMVEKCVRASDVTVLCGDIFEGTNMQISVEKRIDLGKNALKSWSDANSHATIHLLFGNHELPLIKGGVVAVDAPYLKVGNALREYAKTLPNVVFHEKGWAQVGDALFTHGHIQNNYEEPTPNAIRQLIHLPFNIAVPGDMANRYVFPIKEWAAKLHEAFSQEKLDGPVYHVIFGHTHSPKKGYTIPGLRLGGGDHDVQFHNLGASIRMRPTIFQPLIFEQNNKGLTLHIHEASKMFEGPNC